MKRVLVDTSVWSLAFRRKKDSEVARQLGNLILEHAVAIIGPIRQELLSGLSDDNIFNKLVDRLSVYNDFVIDADDYVTAAKFHNICRKNGIQGSHTDFLICAVAHNSDLQIYTTDKDFKNYARF